MFAIRIDLDKTVTNSPFKLKTWMTGETRIITEDVSLQTRVLRSITKDIN